MKNSRFLPILAASVAAGSSIRDAAQAAGCSESNAYTISRTAEFRSQVSDIRNEAIVAAVGKLTSAATQAVDTLTELLGPDNEATIRLNASKAILTHLVPMAELHELKQRVQDIEARSHLKVMR